MLGTTALNLRYFFYPIGNTPAVNVVQDRFRPANGATYDAPVKVLFLAYGDPRNLLFSLWYERNTDEQTKWEFTCCDIDAAVLARNIILISLIIDEVSFTSTWNIFYHLYIPDADIDLLHAQAEKLLLQSDSINRWMSSVYGKAISFLDQDTLNRLRALWTKYAATAALNIDARKQFEVTTRGKIKKMFDRSQENSMHVQGLRSVGPNWTGAVETISYCFSRFWETGVVAGNLPDLQELSSSQGGRVNPMFAISSSSTEEFAVHYGSEPLLGFHLATAFDGHLVGYTTDALGTEAATRLAFPGVPGRQSQYYLRIAWKIPSFGERLEEMASEPLEWEIRSSPEELSMYFFNSIWLCSVMRT
ncbi:hypothetical protein M7I_6973 [Glarea lozoyensis 74030]|uniref:DUF4470 domain-containing protein n=1 Tax=Glarea lozoyensis (strain ATCC 74030 / MF5533) TaxID=1104152 RepID=H0EW36_GLAL7|nr:hypothetical protein M7I_6973 [Glarea lozoyensis 74030]